MLFDKLLSQAKSLSNTSTISQKSNDERLRRFQKEKQEISKKRESEKKISSLEARISKNQSNSSISNSTSNNRQTLSSTSINNSSRRTNTSSIQGSDNLSRLNDPPKKTPTLDKNSTSAYKDSFPSKRIDRTFKSPEPTPRRSDTLKKSDPYPKRPDPLLKRSSQSSKSLYDSAKPVEKPLNLPEKKLSYKELISLAPKKGVGIVNNSNVQRDFSSDKPLQYKSSSSLKQLPRKNSPTPNSSGDRKRPLSSQRASDTPSSHRPTSIRNKDPLPSSNNKKQNVSNSFSLNNQHKAPQTHAQNSNYRDNKSLQNIKNTNVPSLSLPNNAKRKIVSEVDRFNVKSKSSSLKRHSQNSRLLGANPVKAPRNASPERPPNRSSAPKPRPKPISEVDRFGAKSKSNGLSKYSSRSRDSFSEYKRIDHSNSDKGFSSRYSHNRQSRNSRSEYYSEDEEGYGSLDDFIVDDDEDGYESESLDYRKEIRKLTGYDSRRYKNDYDIDDMEVSSSAQLREENISLKIAKLEDKIEEKRLLDLEEMERKRLKKRKLN
ncbi:hypothetical protein AYI69_g1853 [Smittium culicis]|uniref:Protein SPT2-like protein n=1 Tax=Smittium culicis TaxID=133412 RepID=A0A1R1YP23_9FUNG|nr:hypothetical protein AYI69_g1853 [Smittium culicis]